MQLHAMDPTTEHQIHESPDLIVSRVFTCSVKGVVGVEDCGEEAEGERADAERHVKAGVPKTLEHLPHRDKNGV